MAIGFRTKKLPGQPQAFADYKTPLRTALSTPYAAPSTAQARPPGQYYDTSLDDQERAAQRGYGYDLSDYYTQFGQGNQIGGRAGSDLANQVEQLGTQGQDSQDDLLRQLTQARQGLTEQGDDLNTSYGRNTTDLATALAQYQQQAAQTGQRNTQDHDTALANLAETFRRQSVQQTSAAVQGGASRGALSTAKGARATNKANQQAPIDTGFQRGQTDLATALNQYTANNALQQQRLGQDYNTQSGRIAEQAGYLTGGYDTAKSRLERDTTQQTGDLINQYGNAFLDAQTGIRREGDENAIYGQTVQNARLQQATANNWVPPAPTSSLDPRVATGSVKAPLTLGSTVKRRKNPTRSLF